MDTVQAPTKHKLSTIYPEGITEANLPDYLRLGAVRARKSDPFCNAASGLNSIEHRAHAFCAIARGVQS